MRFIYSVVLYCLLPLIIFRLFWLSLRTPAYRQRLAERFGRVRLPENRRPLLWIHAVSVGEVQAARPLVDAIRRCYPQLHILISTTTPTGADTVSRLYPDDISHCYVPYDLPGTVRRFIRRVQPSLFIAMETEIWPNLFRECDVNEVPVVIANARMSAKSLSGYEKLAALSRETLSRVARVLAQTPSDADRFIRMGVAKDKVSITGNLKFDVADSSLDTAGVQKLEKCVADPGRLIWLAASTHAHEEEIILASHARIIATHPGCLLIIAPRHPERFKEVTLLAEKAGFNVQKMTDGDTVKTGTQVFILDTLGDLQAGYALCRAAFIGGSLVPVGGHNPLEAAVRGVPVLFGPHTHNFSDICNNLLECGAAIRVDNTESLVTGILSFLDDGDRCQAAGDAGRQFVESNRGRVDAMLAELQPLLEKSANSQIIK